MHWKVFIYNRNGNRLDEVTHQICQIQDYQNKDSLSVCGILLLQNKPKLGRTKPSTVPHAAAGWT